MASLSSPPHKTYLNECLAPEPPPAPWPAAPRPSAPAPAAVDRERPAGAAAAIEFCAARQATPPTAAGLCLSVQYILFSSSSQHAQPRSSSPSFAKAPLPKRRAGGGLSRQATTAPACASPVPPPMMGIHTARTHALPHTLVYFQIMHLLHMTHFVPALPAPHTMRLPSFISPACPAWKSVPLSAPLETLFREPIINVNTVSLDGEFAVSCECWGAVHCSGNGGACAVRAWRVACPVTHRVTAPPLPHRSCGSVLAVVRLKRLARAPCLIAQPAVSHSGAQVAL